MSVAETPRTLLSVSWPVPMLGPGTTCQAAPSQCSISGSLLPPFAWNPTTQALHCENTATPLSTFCWLPGLGGCAAPVQLSQGGAEADADPPVACAAQPAFPADSALGVAG